MDVFDTLVAQFGAAAKDSLNGPGEPEAALATPVDNLLREYGEKILSRKVVLHAEVREDSGTVRPDFGVRIDGLMSGHVELKKPETSLDPDTYSKSSHNGKQWKRLSKLPNLLHTNGLEWRLWRYGELVAMAHLPVSSLTKFKGAITAPPELDTVLSSFLSWTPTPITTVTRLVDTIAPLAALLREEVLESLQANRRNAKATGREENSYPFIGLKRDWRASLYPNATDEEFADGFAQTVVFALVIALSDGMDFNNIQLRDIAEGLQSKHSLLGRSLDLLTEHIKGSTVGLVLETIIRTLSATDWRSVSGGNQDVYLHLYEHFLNTYDPALRKKSGSYYTPTEVVAAMTRLTDQALQKYLSIPEGLSADSVAVIDPAMGTGTYGLSIVQHVAAQAEKYGPGAVADAVTSVAKRLYGIELQSGPFSVAELRLSQAIQEFGGQLPEDGMHLYVADTLEDPESGTSRELSYTLQLIAQQRQRANRVKLETPIQVCIGNPPYKDKSEGLGGWVEKGSTNSNHTPLDDFRKEGNGKYEYVLKNLYVYFWRWAMWKVFESIPNSTDGVVCFITATGYLNGPGFKGMREWIRRNTSRGWIINLTPEGKQPPAKNAVFNIETPVGIGIFIRNKENDEAEPAEIKYIDLHGTREEKFSVLSNLDLDSDSFQDTGDNWDDGFTPKTNEQWEEYPALNDIYPWTAPGVKPNKTWVYAPERAILEQRWDELIQETSLERKRELFKETRDTTLEKTKNPLPGPGTEQGTKEPFSTVEWPQKPAIIEVGYRSFDRQYIIADSRLLHMPSPSLWAARSPEQIFLVEQHAHYPRTGPGLMFSSLIPDMDSFKGSEGGRALPMLHPDGQPNVAPGLLKALSRHFGREVTAEELTAYIAGISAHPGYVEAFDEELHYSGNRVPLTVDVELWDKAVEIGQFIIWLHTFGDRGHAPNNAQTLFDVESTLPLPTYDTAVGVGMPEDVTYDEKTQTIHLGKGTWSNVSPAVWSYTVGGNSTIKSWVGYRRKKPKGRKSSPLDDIITTSWPTQWSRKFHELLVTLTHLVQLEDEQKELLGQIIAGEQLTKDELASRGVQWPTENKDRKPHFPGELF